MEHTTLIEKILHTCYDETLDTQHLQHIYGSVHDMQMLYHLSMSDGRSWVIRATRQDCPVHESLAACGARTILELLQSRVATLVHLQHCSYPAPRVILTLHGEFIGDLEGWYTSVTTYIEGAVIEPTPEQLRLLGEALGRLHALELQKIVPGDTDLPAPGKSYWYAEAAIPQTLARLAAVEPLLPAEWKSLYTSFRQTVETVEQHATVLPQVIVHADAWPANAVQTAPDNVTLIDWEPGGLGLALLDLGRALLECHLDSNLPYDQPLKWHIQASEQHIAALLEGYSKQRALAAIEHELLLDGIRFGIAFIGAIHFEAALIKGVQARSMDVRLARLRNRLEVSQAIATLASRYSGSRKDIPVVNAYPPEETDPRDSR